MDARPFLGRQARKIALNRGSNGSLLYLNSAYLGRGAWGVEMAARSYFGKSAQDLSVAEGAMLAGLLKGPSFFNPDRHPDRAKERLAYVLGRMKEDGVISAEDEERALAAPPKLLAFEQRRRDSGLHFIDFLGREAKIDGVTSLTANPTPSIRPSMRPCSAKPKRPCRRGLRVLRCRPVARSFADPKPISATRSKS